MQTTSLPPQRSSGMAPWGFSKWKILRQAHTPWPKPSPKFKDCPWLSAATPQQRSVLSDLPMNIMAIFPPVGERLWNISKEKPCQASKLSQTNCTDEPILSARQEFH